MYKLIDGRVLSKQIKDELVLETKKLKEEGINVTLAVIIVGGDPASRVYVNNKEKDCAELGIISKEFALSEDTTEEELLTLIDKLNKDDSVNGILCQLPLPKHLDERTVIAAIDPKKDVDAFHTENVGKIMIGDFDFLPCTPAGVMEMIDRNNIEVQGKHCVVIGRSNIVGKPMALLLLHRNATVTICHSKTVGLAEICKQADILVSAVGRAKFVTPDMVKDGAVVIDVGMNRFDGKLCGDVDFDAVCQKTSAITPVPGGVGPMTRAVLMKNTVHAAKIQNGVKW